VERHLTSPAIEIGWSQLNRDLSFLCLHLMTQTAWAPPEFFRGQAASFLGEEILSSFTEGGRPEIAYEVKFKPFKNCY
jgi:hypothetical protein